MILFYSALMETQEQRHKFEYIYEKYYGFMYHIAFSITQNAHHAEDAVHETCLALIERIDDLRIDSQKEFISYLHTLTRNRTIDYLRKWCNDKRNESDSWEKSAITLSHSEEVVLSNLLLGNAIQQLSCMPEKYRTPLVLKVKGYSIQEIAWLLNLTEGAVKTRIFRARQILIHSFET